MVKKKKCPTKIDYELCRCEGLNDCRTMYKNNNIKSVLDVYEARTMRNGGNISATTTATNTDSKEMTEEERGGVSTTLSTVLAQCTEDE